jgi:hypothetical protein
MRPAVHAPSCCVALCRGIPHFQLCLDDPGQWVGFQLVCVIFGSPVEVLVLQGLTVSVAAAVAGMSCSLWCRLLRSHLLCCGGRVARDFAGRLRVLSSPHATDG